MGDFTNPTSKPYSSSQIGSLIKGAFGGNGYTSSQQSALQNAFVGIAGAESGGQTGVVNNTAYSDLPGYTSPGPNDTPEFSVGLFQMNLYDRGNYNASASALGQAQLGQGQNPTSAQAYALGGQLAGSPQAQAAAASTLYQSSQFSPWTDSYVTSAGGPGALYSSVTGGQAPPSSYPAGTAASAGSSSSSSATGTSSGAVNGQCDATKCVTSTLFGFCPLKECTAKHLVGGLACIGGGLIALVGVALLFVGGKNAIGNAAQLGLNAVPGGVGVAAQKVVKRAATKGGVPQQSRKAKSQAAQSAASEQEQQLQDAHAQGVWKGRSQGRQSNGLKVGVNRGSGARYEEVA